MLASAYTRAHALVPAISSLWGVEKGGDKERGERGKEGRREGRGRGGEGERDGGREERGERGKEGRGVIRSHPQIGNTPN